MEAVDLRHNMIGAPMDADLNATGPPTFAVALTSVIQDLTAEDTHGAPAAAEGHVTTANSPPSAFKSPMTVHRMSLEEHPPASRNLSFSVENILDPNKFTGAPHPLKTTPPIGLNNNHIYGQHAAGLFHFHTPAHWLSNAAAAAAAAANEVAHAAAGLHESSTTEDDSLYDRSDAESGKFHHFFWGVCYLALSIELVR